MNISYNVFQPNGSVLGNPETFKELAKAQDCFSGCKGSAILIIRAGKHESVYNSKGLGIDEIRSLMEWSNDVCPHCGSQNFEWFGDAVGKDNDTPYHCYDCDKWFDINN